MADEQHAPKARVPGGSGGQRMAEAPRATAMLHDRYEIRYDRQLTALDTPVAEAFAVTALKGGRGELFALVSKDHTPTRRDILSSLRTIDSPALMRPVRWGVVDTPVPRRRSFAVIYDQPAGARLMAPSAQSMRPMPEERLIKGVIAPIAAALAGLAARGITHRALRPDNLFYRDASHLQVQLGDGAMAPPGATQPVIFETIENGMTDPQGRGPGSPADDLYALGATVVVLLFGRDPVAGMDDDAIVAAKIDKGSYGVLVGNQSVSPDLREVLRGLLADNQEKRWALDDLTLWLDGRRLSPLQSMTPERAMRPFVVGAAEYFTCRGLAFGIGRTWSVAAPALEKADLEGWVRRSVGDKWVADAVAEVTKSGVGGGLVAGSGAANDIMTGKICVALDPPGPLRYKGLSAMVDGLGPVLYRLQQKKGGAKLFADLIFSELPVFWVTKRLGIAPEGRALVRMADRLRLYLKRGKPGWGIERCLYEMNPSLACMSALVEARYVLDPEDLLPALEAAAKGGAKGSLPMDRHIAAFIASRFGQGAEDHLAAFADRNDPVAMVLGVLRALALMQWRLGPPSLPALTAWIGKSVLPVIDGYHSGTLGRKMRARLDAVLRGGSLTDLVNLIDDPKLRRQDKRSFAVARSRYAAAEAEITRLGRSRGYSGGVEPLANRLAATVSVIIAVATGAVLALLNL